MTTILDGSAGEIHLTFDNGDRAIVYRSSNTVTVSCHGSGYNSALIMTEAEALDLARVISGDYPF